MKAKWKSNPWSGSNDPRCGNNDPWNDGNDPWSGAEMESGTGSVACASNDGMKCAESLMIAVIKAGASRHVAAAVASALYHVQCGRARESIDMQAEIVAVAKFHLGEDVGIGAVNKHLKSNGHAELAKDLSKLQKHRNAASHPPKLLPQRLDKALIACAIEGTEGIGNLCHVKPPSVGELFEVAPRAKVAEGDELETGADSAEAAPVSDEDKEGDLARYAELMNQLSARDREIRMSPEFHGIAESRNEIVHEMSAIKEKYPRLVEDNFDVLMKFMFSGPASVDSLSNGPSYEARVSIETT